MFNLLPLPVPALPALAPASAPDPLLPLAFEVAGPVLFAFFLVAMLGAVTLSFTHD